MNDEGIMVLPLLSDYMNRNGLKGTTKELSSILCPWRHILLFTIAFKPEALCKSTIVLRRLAMKG